MLSLFNKKSKQSRETKTEVKTLQQIPMASVTANPLIGPVPSAKRASAAIRVVALASKIVLHAFSNPISIEVRGVLLSLISSRIRSKIKTFASTAIPTVKINPANPGNVRVAPKAAIIDKIKGKKKNDTSHLFKDFKFEERK